MPDVVRNMNPPRASPVSDSHQNPPTGMINGRGVPQGLRLRPAKLVKEWKIRAGTWNVGTLTGRLRAIADVMERRRIDFLCVQETRWKGSGTREIGNGYKLYYSGSREGRNGVGIIVSNNWKEKVVEVKRVNDRLLKIPIITGDKVVNIRQEKELFRQEFEDAISTVREEEKLIIGADMNGRVGKRRDGYEEVHRGHGFGIRNEDVDYILAMAESFELACMNTWFQK
ncbi:craniofacial development protein 2-like [Macrobrachium rosenbergii]|uniref:craniofacial development protein 2-like n=1 Tax=Macrobrachium rosenbergii TaxID=79674 RepID=UPI0034D5E20D